MKNKFSIALSLAVIMAMLLTSLALADDISNNLDASVDAVAEVMALNVGGANGTTQLYVVERNSDGKNGCNLTGSKTLVVSVTSSDTNVATVSPSSVTFTSCGFTQILTVTPVAAGSTTISLSQTSNSTDGSFDLAPATFTVNVEPASNPNTAPQVAVAGVTGGANYNKGSVPAATCQVTDAEDGNSSFAATLSTISGPYASDGLGEQTASCSYTDGGGLTAIASETYNIVDPSAPSIGYTLNPATPDGSNNWYVGGVTLTWNVSEPESPNSLQKTDCVDQNITADQAETSYSCSATSAGGSTGPVSVSIKRDGTAPFDVSGEPNRAPDSGTWYNHAVDVEFTGSDATSGIANCTTTTYNGPDGNGITVNGSCTDNAGNTSASVDSSAFNYDATAPTISAAVSAGTAGLNGWYVSNVTVHFTCTDSGSGIPAGACPEDQVLTAEGAAVSSTAQTVTDAAGNISALSNVVTVKIDKTAPSITITTPANSASYLLNQIVAADYSCTDGTSGVALCAGPVADGANIDTASAGSKDFTVNASDEAGNTNSETNTYDVSYKVCALYDQTKSHKKGSTVPVKLQLCDANGMNVSSASIVVRAISVSKIDNTASTAVEDSGAANSPDMNFRYDATLGGSGGYIFNLSTKSLTTGTWKVIFTVDGSGSYFVQFDVK